MNNLRIIKFKTSDKVHAVEAFAIRRKVFVDEQRVDPLLEYDKEEESTHYLVFMDDKPVTTGRFRKTSEGIKLERFATLKEYRNKGIGAELLKTMLADIINLKQNIYLNSQIAAIPFYERYGFKKVGDIFYEAGMAHFRMEYQK